MKQAHWESATQKDLSNRDNSGCYLYGEGRGHKPSFVCFLFPMKTSLCSSLCTSFIPMVTISHIIYLNWKPMPSFMQSYHDVANSALSLLFWRLVSWSRLFSSDICDSFPILKKQSLFLPFVIPELTKCLFWLFQKHLFVCCWLWKLIKSIYIFVRLPGSWRRKYTFFLLPEC